MAASGGPPLVAPAAGWEPLACPPLLHPPPMGFLHHVTHCALDDPPAAVAFSVDLGGALAGVDEDVAAAVMTAAAPPRTPSPTAMATAITTESPLPWPPAWRLIASGSL